MEVISVATSRSVEKGRGNELPGLWPIGQEALYKVQKCCLLQQGLPSFMLEEAQTKL
jgi:hypothetical protein